MEIHSVKNPDRMASYWKSEAKTIALVTLFGLLFNGCMSLVPILQGRLIDTIVNRAAMQTIFIAAALFVAVVLFVQLMRVGKRYYVRLFANHTSAAMRKTVYHTIMSRSAAELSEETAGDLMTKAVSDVDICVEGMRKVTTEIFDTGILMTSYLVALFLYDGKITAIACVFVPVAMALAEKLKKMIVKYTKEYRAESSRIAQMTYENAENALVLRLGGAAQDWEKEYERELAVLEKKAIRAMIPETSMQPIYNAIAMLGVVFVFLLGGEKVVSGAWSVGEFSAYLTMFTLLAVKAGKAAKLFNSFQKARVSWRRIKPFMCEAEAKDKAQVEDAGGGICVRDLSFVYPHSDMQILKSVSFAAARGQIIGITGGVACGKSTLAAVLQGIYPYGGSVTVCGRELSDYTPFQRSCRISCVEHMPQLLSDTIYNNITLGDGGDVAQVLRDVDFEEDLQGMPLGVNTLVGNGGVKLSGGQQARIALARALYHKSALLILDDPFSAVDMKSEKKIFDALRKNYGDRTILLISHRLALFSQTDGVLMLQDGIGQYAAHGELLKNCPPYAALYRRAQGGAL